MIDESVLLLHTLEQKYLPLRRQKEINFKMCVAVRKLSLQEQEKICAILKVCGFQNQFLCKVPNSDRLFEGGVAYSCHSYPTVPNRKTRFELLIIHALCVERICM